MANDVSVVTWGEFCRPPRINDQAGRDHWPQVGGALLAGGGMQAGQVIGSTDRLGGEPNDRPVHFGEVISTIYHNLGIDANAVTVDDLSGRPRYLVDDWQPLRALVEIAIQNPSDSQLGYHNFSENKLALCQARHRGK